jgi:hypothetical protein
MAALSPSHLRRPLSKVETGRGCLQAYAAKEQVVWSRSVYADLFRLKRGPFPYGIGNRIHAI